MERLGIFLDRIRAGASLNDLQLQGEFSYLCLEHLKRLPECNSCPGVIDGILKELKVIYSNSNPKPTIKMAQNYSGKVANEVLYDSNTGNHINSSSATDEQIVRLIASNKNFSKRFNCPDGWEKEVSEMKKVIEKEKADRIAASRASEKKEEEEKKNKKVNMSVVESTGTATPEAAEEFIKSSTKKALVQTAKKAAIEGYTTMSVEELQTALLERLAEEVETSEVK